MILRLVCIAALLGPEGQEDVRAQVEALFEEGRYDEAVERARAEYARTGDPVFLYVEAQAERFRGDCHRAIELYGRVLARSDAGTMAENARDNIETCEQQLRAKEAAPQPKPEPQPEPASQPAVDVPPPDPGPPPDARPRWWRDPAGGALVGIGGIGLVTGIGLLVGGASQRDRAMEADDEASFVDGQRAGGRLVVAGAVVGGVGLAVAVAGIVRWAVVARRDRGSTPAGVVLRF